MADDQGMIMLRAKTLLALTVSATILLTGTLSGQSSPRFQRIDVQDGLSQSSVTSIVQDPTGFIWLGTQDGLNRYDGHGFRIYRSEAEGDASGSLQSSYVHDLLTTRNGTLWVATNGGLSRFLPESDRFQTFTHDVDDPASLPSNTVRTLHEDADGRLWAGTFRGLVLVDPIAGVERIYLTDLRPPDQDVRAITHDEEGRIWIGSSRGLRILDPETGGIRGAPVGAEELDSAFVWDLFRDDDGTIWVGTSRRGLVAVSPEDGSVNRYRAADTSLTTDEIRRVFRDRDDRLWVGTGDGVALREAGRDDFDVWRHEPSDPVSLSQSAVWAIAQDRGGLVWLGTMTGGVSVWDPRTRAFARYRHRPGDPTSLPGNVVYEILGDAQGRIWVGTRASGVARFHPEDGRFTPFEYGHSGGPPRVVAFADDPRGWLWIATHQRGLYRVAPETGETRAYRHRPGDPGSLASDRTRDVVVHPDGSVWVGTSGAGLDRLEPETGRIRHFRWREGDESSLTSDFVRGLYIDDAGAVWVATYGQGGNRLDPGTGVVRRYRHDSSDPRSLSSNFVRSITQDSSGRIWFSTDEGLSLLSEGGGFERYRVDDGLPNGVVYGALEDDRGRLWVSTNGGIAAFDPASGSFTTFDADDGLQADEFNTNAFWEDPRGRMYFGGVEGLTVFHPDDVELNDFVPPVVLTEYRLYNRRVEPADSSGLPVEISRAASVAVAPEDDMIGFSFAALGFRQPWKHRFRYRMEGFDDRWVETEASERHATFTGMPPGRYAFAVQAANDDGVWNEAGARITVDVLPHFWQTSWFRMGVGVLGVALLTLGVASWQRRLRVHNRELAEAVEERTGELRERTEALEASLTHIKRLEGILPICSSCKSIRVEDGEGDDAGRQTWVPVDAYITDRTDAGFSHGICPDCVDDFYPDYAEEGSGD